MAMPDWIISTCWSAAIAGTLIGFISWCSASVPIRVKAGDEDRTRIFVTPVLVAFREPAG